MALDEQSRHELYLKLEQVPGAREAATLMEHLPPVGWADVATKRDLDHARIELTAEFRAELSGQVASLQRHLMTMMMGSMLTLGGLAFAAARLV